MEKTTAARIASIDLLRGLVMVVMALDHVRDYFHADSFRYDPMDLDKTSVILFFTRWVTHYCAPTFMFLSGVSAFLSSRRKTRKELSVFLLKRGFWLVLLEWTIIRFGWLFTIGFNPTLLIVIWALGVSMIVLAGLIWLPRDLILLFGLVLVFGHNLLDTIHVGGEGAASVGWAVLHERRIFQFGSFQLMVAYPMIPWIGVMALGWVAGGLYAPGFPAARRKKLLLRLGMGAIMLFILLRLSNLYGDPVPWTHQRDGVFTVLSFLKVYKYPPSLLYLLMTLGPDLVFLALTENSAGGFSRFLSVYGRVPMFYYILHIYLLHLLAMLSIPLCGHPMSDMLLHDWPGRESQLRGTGFSLGIVYMVWLFVVLALYPLCRWYDRYKQAHREQWWLGYL